MAQYTIAFSTNANQIIRDLERVSGKIAEVARTGRSVQLSLDSAPLRTAIGATFRQLDKQIALLQRKLAKVPIGSQAFQMRAAQLGTLQGVRERGGMQATAIQLKKQSEAFDTGSAERLQRMLQAVRIEASQITPNTTAWVDFQRQIGQIKGQLVAADRAAESIQLQSQLGAFSPGSLNALETKLIILRNRAREISPNTTEWKELNKEISKSEQAIEKQTRRPLTRGQRFGAAGGAFLYGGGLGGGAGSAIGGIAGGLLGGVPGAFAGAAAGQLADNLMQQAAGVTKFIAEVNKSKIALAGVTKDIGDYQNALSSAQEAGKLFLIPIQDSIQQFTKLQASIAGAGYETETTQQVFKGIAAAIVATGGSTEDLNGALRATAQVFSKGKVTAEELRGQIGERLPGAFTIFAQATGRSTQQLDEDLQKGKVTLNDFIKFTNELFKRYGSTAEILAKAPENAGARLEVALQAATYEYLGMFQVVGAAFQSYAADLVNFVAQNKSAISAAIAEFVVFAQDLYSILSSVVESLFPVFKNLFSFMFSNFAKGLNSLAILADETRRAAGGPEKRAAAMVDQLYKGRPLEGHFGGRLQAYQQALNVELQYEKGAPSRARSRSQRVSEMEKVLFPQFTPSQFGKGLGRGGGIDNLKEGAGGRGGKGKELKDFAPDQADALRQQLDLTQKFIESSVELTTVEKELESAQQNRLYGLAIVDVQLKASLATLKEYKQSQRDLARQSFESQAAVARENVEAQYKKELLGDLFKRSADYEQQISKLKNSIAALSGNTKELTEVEVLESLIKDRTNTLTEKQRELIQQVLGLLRKQAKEITDLTAKEKELQRIAEVKKRITNLKEEIALLRAVNKEEEARLRIRQENKGITKQEEDQVYQLQKVRDNIKNVREIIDSFVTDTSSDYKGFLKAVINGEDAADALQQFQEGLQDRVLTIFLDFTMKPVEDFFKDVVGGKLIEKLFPQNALEKGQGLEAKSTDPVQATNENTNATTTNTTAIQNLTNALNGQVTGAAAGNAAGFNTFDTNILSQGMQSTIKGMDFGVGFGAGGGLVGAAVFSRELGDISTGLQNAMPSLTGFSEAINGFSAASVDTAIKTANAAKDTQQSGAEFAKGLGSVVQGIGIALSSAMTIMAGIQQIGKGGTKNTLAGIGSILMGIGGGIGGFLKMGKAANGAVWQGGFQAFANGGTVQGPTLGLIGEGKYNEAIVPLPDGKSIPVQLNGDSIRDKMSGSSNGGGYASPVLSMNFETTTINNVEYVSRDQLERAMMETRRIATRDGARQGANLAIDKLQQSPTTRRRIGI
jgi:tape measure domain-containing protein